jgi:hypothetical protein
MPNTLNILELCSSKNMFKAIDNSYSNYKSFLNFISKINFNHQTQYTLLKADAFANSNFINDGVDFLNHLFGFKDELPDLKYKLTIPYIMEKLIIYADGNNELLTQSNTSKVFNTFNNLNNISNDNGQDNFIKKLFFLLSNEQMNIQERDHTDNLIRILATYKESHEIKQFIKDTYNIEFNKLVLLHWILLVYITKNKITTIYFSIEDFKKYATNSLEFDISVENIDNFLKYTLIDKQGFKTQYQKIRTDINGNYLSYEKLTKIDRILPRISYRYPLIQDNEKMMLLSYTSFLQFIKLEKLYDIIYHKFKGNNIHGEAVENYVKQYAKINNKNTKVYGNEKYKIKKIKYDAPDVIIESENYVIFIEVKSKPFHILEAISSFDTYGFDKIKSDIKLSYDNIDRYLKYQNKFEDKKIYKIVCYYFNNPSMLSSLDNRNDLNRIILTDIQSIENLLTIKDIPLNIILDGFMIEKQKSSTSSLSHYCISNYDIKHKNYNDFERFIKSFTTIKTDTIP